MFDISEAHPYRLEDFDRAIERALVDPDYRARLLADSKSAFREEGVEFPKDVRVTVTEFDIRDRHYVLPPAAMTELGVVRPYLLATDERSE